MLRADSLGGSAIHWDESRAKMREVDIVVSCTGAPNLVLTRKDVAASLRGRRLGPLFLIDIAVPRDVDPKANELDGVYVYDIDALQNVIETNMEERRQAAKRAKQLISEEVSAFTRWVESQEITPVIVSAMQTAEAVTRGGDAGRGLGFIAGDAPRPTMAEASIPALVRALGKSRIKSSRNASSLREPYKVREIRIGKGAPSASSLLSLTY